jgi:hypothetical protein
MKITSFGRDEHRLLSAAITKALKDVADEFGVDLTAGGGQIGMGSGRVNVEVKVRETASGVSGAQATWDRQCRYYGLMPEHFGMSFMSNGSMFKITGLQSSRPKYPINAMRVHDKQSFKFAVSTVLAKLPMKAAA